MTCLVECGLEAAVATSMTFWIQHKHQVARVSHALQTEACCPSSHV